MRFSRAVFVVLLALVLAPARATDWGELMSREQAMRQLDSSDARARREALARLAEIGTPDDVPYMLRLLRDDDRQVRGMAEQALWGLWLRPNDLAAKRMFLSGIVLIQQNEMQKAITQLDELIAYKPEFAEAWNKRGDAWLELGEFERALADYRETLRINPYHFGAMQSSGEVWLERGDARRAADHFRQALEINPNLLFLVPILRELEERLENDRI